MFRPKRDILARQVDAEVKVWDFFDVGSLGERQEKVAGTGMAMTVVGVLGGRMIGGVGWIDDAMGTARVMGCKNMRRLILPGIVAAVILATSYALSSIPRSLPKRLSTTLSHRLHALDYPHVNSTQIATEVRKVLHISADNLRVGLQRSVEHLAQKQPHTDKVKIESEVARKYFGNLVRESAEVGRSVEGVDLEGPAPGIAGGSED